MWSLDGERLVFIVSNERGDATIPSRSRSRGSRRASTGVSSICCQTGGNSHAVSGPGIATCQLPTSRSAALGSGAAAAAPRQRKTERRARAARRAGSRPAAPFARGTRSPHRSDRPQAGAAYGRAPIAGRRRTSTRPTRCHSPRVSALLRRGAPRTGRDAVSRRAAGATADRPRISRGHRSMHAVPPARPRPPSAPDLRCARRGGRARRPAGHRLRRAPQ